MNFSKEIISIDGYFISKIFMGGTFNEIVAEGKKIFKEVIKKTGKEILIDVNKF